MKRFTIFSFAIVAILTLQLKAQSSFEIKVFLEGPFEEIEMNTSLNESDLIPIAQPYHSPPWNYWGAEQVGVLPNIDIVDWILVELRETNGDASTATAEKMINRQAAFLKKDGSIVGLDGTSLISYSGVVTNSLFLVIWHRNHLAIMSSVPLSESGGIYIYDFTTQLSGAYLDGQKEITTGKFGMIAGDCDASGRVLSIDKKIQWQEEAGENGYFRSDLNFDGQVDNNDKDDLWNINYGLVSKLPDELDWECSMDFIDSRDGQSYTTVQIGSQCWMKENMNVGEVIQGNIAMSDNSIIERYCYDNDTVNCDVYGGLYQWNEVMQYSEIPRTQGICPDGWYVPSKLEYMSLYIPFGGITVAGGKLKEAGTIHWSSPNTGATNQSGFTALPGGWKYYYSPYNFTSLHTNGYFWTSSLSSPSSTSGYKLSYNSTDLNWTAYAQGMSFSLRCIKNLPALEPYKPAPENGSNNVSTNAVLHWSGFDTEDDALLYDIYFGSIYPPQKVVSMQSYDGYNPGSLLPNTTYYWKVAIYDDQGNFTMGPFWSFTTGVESNWDCGNALVDTRDDQIYYTVELGSKCWMAENLNIGAKIDNNYSQADNGVFEKYCYYNLNEKCEIYGGLYQWNELMQYTGIEGNQGICPSGWHVPKDNEWSALEYNIDNTIHVGNFGWRGTDGGAKLKEMGSVHWTPPNTDATNLSGFTSLPGGKRENDGDFEGISSNSYYFTSTTNPEHNYNAFSRKLTHGYNSVFRDVMTKSHGQSVRCIKDYINQAPAQPSNPFPADVSLNNHIYILLTWESFDPEFDSLNYDVYFGTDNPPTIVSSGQSTSRFYPGTLNINTNYYWKIVAHDNQSNFTQSPIWQFTTGNNQVWECNDPIFDTRDNQAYSTIQIEDQCWMQENLNIGLFITNNTQTNNNEIEKFCYDNDTINCDIYGGLYQWDEMMQYEITPDTQGICIDGWHIPADEEWTELTDTLGGLTIAGGKLKQTGTLYWNSPNTGATNESGFTALPGGYKGNTGSSYQINDFAYFHSSTESSVDNNWFRVLRNYNTEVTRGSHYKNYGRSVRCIKNN